MNLIHPVWGELTGLSDHEEDQILCDIRDRILGLGEYERYQHHGPVQTEERPMSWECYDVTRECACGRGTYTVQICSNNAKIQTEAGIPKINCDRCRARFSLKIDQITGEETWSHPPLARVLTGGRP